MSQLTIDYFQSDAIRFYFPEAATSSGAVSINPDCPLDPKPLPTSPFQGRSGFGSPPDKGESVARGHGGGFEHIPPNGQSGINNPNSDNPTRII